MKTATPKSVRTVFKKLLQDFNAYSFRADKGFSWSSDSATIAYKQPTAFTDIWLLLHEIAHAELGHRHYHYDIDLTRMEAEAWDYAKKSIAPHYKLIIDGDFIEDTLDTYRLWLHARSTCPRCTQTGAQATKNTYSCINCRCSWQVYEARLCGVRRRALSSGLGSAAN